MKGYKLERLFTIIDKHQVISVTNKTLDYMDKRLVAHGKRVAFIVSEMLKVNTDRNINLNTDDAIIMALFHDIGAYKTDEIDEMIQIDCKDVWKHSVFGYMFLKNMSPMGDVSEAILLHHIDYADYDKSESEFVDYAAIIHLADRFDILLNIQGSDANIDLILKHSGTVYDPKFVDLLVKANPSKLAKALGDGSFEKTIEGELNAVDMTAETAFEFLKMMIFAIDFRSEHTVTHTINTTGISMELGRLMNIPDEDMRKLYFGALLHDIGKIAIDVNILEYEGKLTDDQMAEMRKHIIYTREIIEGLVDNEICEIASRHHEKIDGTGYPEGLEGQILSLPEKIVAVADIVSALASKRSYKEAFEKEKTLEIIEDLSQNNKISKEVSDVLINNYDEIMEVTNESKKPIMELYERMKNEYELLYNRIEKSVQGTME